MTLSGAGAPAAVATPNCDDAVLPLFMHSPEAGNSEASHAPPPPLGGQGWREGGCAFEWLILSENNYLSNFSFLEAIERLIKNKPSEINKAVNENSAPMMN